MAVYVDKLVTYANKGYTQWAHMWADELHELHRMAETIGLKRSWLQIRNSEHFKYHYDLSAQKREMAIKHGAIEMQASKWLKAQKEKQP